jgi:hypothetical protein
LVFGKAKRLGQNEVFYFGDSIIHEKNEHYHSNNSGYVYSKVKAHGSYSDAMPKVWCQHIFFSAEDR